MINFILCIFASLILGFIFFIVGKFITTLLKINEENNLLHALLNIALGVASFLIIINLSSALVHNFFIGTIITLVVLLGIVIYSYKNCFELVSNIKSISLQNVFSKTNQPFLLLMGGINLLYGLVVFSHIPPQHFATANNHFFNVSQLLANNYPLKYNALPTLSQKFHYGADILAATLSRFSGAHVEISLDVLALIFINLTVLVLFAFATKYTNSNNLNKVIVPFAALIAWGPILLLFKKIPGEIQPSDFIEKLIFLAQTRLNETAKWSGLVLHWLAEPPTGIGIFLILISFYLIFRLTEEGFNLRFSIALGVFLSSLAIIDITALCVIAVGIVLYIVLLSPIPLLDSSSTTDKEQWINMLKNFAVLAFTAVAFGLLHQNWFVMDQSFISLSSIYKLGSSNMDSRFSHVGNNTILLALYCIGFYQAYKTKQKWLIFLIPFFAVSLTAPYFTSMPNAGIGKFAMFANIIGALSIPQAIQLIQEKVTIKNDLKPFIIPAVLILVSLSTLMYAVFGNTNKPLLQLKDKKLQFTGLQTIDNQISNEDLYLAVKTLKSKDRRGQSILCQEEFNDIFSAHTGTYNLSLKNSLQNSLIKKETLDKITPDYNNAFAFDKNIWESKKINWLYLTPYIFNEILFPQAKIKLLDAYLSNMGNLVQASKSNELYQITPSTLASSQNIDFGKLSKQFLSNQEKNKSPKYIKEIALCPYSGTYNAASNDFDGDGIADVAFLDPLNKKWLLIYGKDQKEEEIDLSQNILQEYNGTDLLVPIPADYDGDKKTDIAIFNVNEARWYILESKSSFLRRKIFCWLADEIPLPMDVDSDGKADITCYNATRKSWPTLLSAANQQFVDRNFPTPTVSTSLYADIDGDKSADYVLYSPEKKQLSVYISSNNFNPTKSIKVILGEPSSKLVLEDYDGDKKTDIAIWTPENGNWEVAYAKDLLSLDTSTAPQPFIGCGITNPTVNENAHTTCITHSFSLGGPGSIPMPGDYNGDGKAELAIYDTKTNTLEILSSDGTKRSIDLSKYRGLTIANFIGV